MPSCIRKYKPNFIAGVPTLYEALLRVDEHRDSLDLSCLKGVFSGGDSLSVELKKQFDEFLHDHGAPMQRARGLRHHRVRHRQLPDAHRTCIKEGSIGIPFPDTYYKIVKPGTAGRGALRRPRARSAWPAPR